MQFPVFGTTKRLVDTGRVLHRIPDSIVHAGLVEDLNFATDDAPWYACVLRRDGCGTLRGISDTTRLPPQDALDKMLTLATKLHLELAHDGHWVVFWANDELGALWRDADGDMQFEVTFGEAWERMRAWDWTEFASRCSGAWDEWQRRMREHVEVRPNQKFKRAQGEKAPSQTRH